MARRAFFSFHYRPDIWRVSQVRNSWLLSGETNTFLDSASWESIKRQGAPAIKAWINRQLRGTSVTVVLIGQHTATRRYVQYEVRESFERGNGLLGIYIHRIRDSRGQASVRGRNPLDDFVVDVAEEPALPIFGGSISRKRRLSALFRTYDWALDDGRKNIGRWIEDAARRAGR